VNILNNTELINKNFSKKGAELTKLFVPGENDKVVLVRDFTENENAIWILMENWQEVVDSFTRLEQCIIYLKEFKYYPDIPKIDHIRFIISTYLNTIYMLNARVSKLSKIIKRLLKSEKENEELKNLYIEFDKAESKLTTVLDKLKKTRGEDVHQKKYDTPELNNCSGDEYSIELLNLDKYKTYLQNEISEAQRKYLLAFTKTNNKIKKELDNYYGSINKILFEAKYIEKVKTEERKFYN
jgi:hypothetical protein